MTKGIVMVVFLLVFANCCFAEAQKSKDWVWDLSGEKYAYAATVNNEGRVLGQYCYYADGSCVYLVSLGITCEEGEQYPSIINSDTGVAEVRLICGEKNGEENVFIAYPFDDVNKIIKEADNVGFAVALNRGAFKVVRFSLSGSNHSIEMMRYGAGLINESKTTNDQPVKTEQYL